MHALMGVLWLRDERWMKQNAVKSNLSLPMDVLIANKAFPDK